MKCLMAFALSACIVFTAGCGGEDGGSADLEPEKAFTISSPELGGHPVEEDITCMGAGRAPTVTWANPPSGATTMVITLLQFTEDGREMPLLLVSDIPVETGEWAGSGGVMGKNIKGQNAYAPPCPQEQGRPQMCRLSVVAVEGTLGLPGGFSLADMKAALEGKEIALERMDFAVER